MFFNWICDFLPQRLYDRRLQLAGREFGNGFEVWRQLKAKFEGSGAILDVAGADCLHAFPKCKSPKDLEEHLDAWEEMLDKYGGQLIDFAPAHVRVMLIKTLPTEIETELLDNPQLDTWDKIIAWCRRRIRYKNQKFSASYLRPGSSRVHVLRHDESSDSEDDQEPPKRAPRGRDTTGRPDPRDMETMIAAMVRKQMKGNRTTSPARDQKKRFIWDKGCHECGGDHMKSECGKWKKLMSDNNGRMPPGHINAYSKARDAFNKANGIVPKSKPPFAKKAHAKALLGDDIDSDFSSNDSEAGFQTAMKSMRTRVNAVTIPNSNGEIPLQNKYSALLDSDEPDADMIDCLNHWAHKVQRKPSKIAK